MATSLKARAVAHLARRDWGRSELRERLLRPPRPAPSRPRGRDTPTPGGPDAGGPCADPRPAISAPTPAEVDAALDALQAAGYLDDARVAANRAQARAPREGLRRIRGELARRGLELDADTAAQLAASELERARAIWTRRFGGRPPADRRELARQWRFLRARGFEAGTVARLLGDVPDHEADGDTCDAAADPPAGCP